MTVCSRNMFIIDTKGNLHYTLTHGETKNLTFTLNKD